MKDLLLLVNPKAGKTKSRAPLFDAVSIFSDAGYRVFVHCTTGRGDAAAFVRSCAQDYDLVVCSGGDGTLNETLTGLQALPNPPPVGYLPAGSTNDFAASLRISVNPVSAARAIVQGEERLLDIGRFNARFFTYVASFGAFSRSSYRAPQAAKNALGHFAYLLEGMKDLNTLHPYRVKLTADGETLDGDYLFGAISNSTSLGGLVKLDHKRVVLDDGKFELLLLPDPKTPLGLQNLIFALLYQQYDHEGVIFRHVSHVTVESAEELSWSLDGESAPSEPRVEIQNLRCGLKLLL